mmetsp:Transcript_6708/g.17952  ORF Transcript_6708/g.17952 Transcript_6708/m.17952 type:complete len:116 (-) Transcript_6708:477-824(-)
MCPEVVCLQFKSIPCQVLLPLLSSLLPSFSTGSCMCASLTWSSLHKMVSSARKAWKLWSLALAILFWDALGGLRLLTDRTAASMQLLKRTVQWLQLHLHAASVWHEGIYEWHQWH